MNVAARSFPWALAVLGGLAVAGGLAIALNPESLFTTVEILDGFLGNLGISLGASAVALLFGSGLAFLLRRPGLLREAATVVAVPLRVVPPYLLLLLTPFVFLPLLGTENTFYGIMAALGLGHAPRVAEVLETERLAQAWVPLLRRLYAVLRDSSLVGLVGLADSLRAARAVASATADYVAAYLPLLYLWVVVLGAVHLAVRALETRATTKS